MESLFMQLKEEMDDICCQCMKQFIGVDMLRYMSTEDVEILKKCFNTYDTTMEFMKLCARKADEMETRLKEMDRRTEKLLKIIEETRRNVW